MDGIHDLAGLRGFGAVEVEPDEPVFHAPWQAKTLQLMLYIGGALKFNADQYRHSVERLEPAHYLAAHYYERALTGITTLLVEAGMVSHADLEARAGGRYPLARPIAANPVVPTLPQPEPRFAVGDAVTVRNISPAGHSRTPKSVRGKRGIVLHIAPRFRLPDVSAHGNVHRPEHSYHVEFSAGDLWPDAAEPGHSVIVDIWDSHLEPAA
jgi:nitrile hydratase subunit beta